MPENPLSLAFDDPAAAATPAATVEDWSLVDGLRNGDEAAYEELIARFEQPVFGVIVRLMDDPSEASDVIQEVFLKVFRNISHFRGESSLKTWIYRIAVNEARNHHRWFGRHRGKEIDLEPVTPDSIGLSDRLTDPGPDPFQITLDHEMESLIEAGLKRISSQHRTVLVLREIEGLSYEEVAQILDLSLGTVKSRILRGRQALRGELTELIEPAASHSEWSLPLEVQGSDAA